MRVKAYVVHVFPVGRSFCIVKIRQIQQENGDLLDLIKEWFRWQLLKKRYVNDHDLIVRKVLFLTHDHILKKTYWAFVKRRQIYLPFLLQNLVKVQLALHFSREHWPGRFENIPVWLAGYVFKACPRLLVHSADKVSPLLPHEKLSQLVLRSLLSAQHTLHALVKCLHLRCFWQFNELIVLVFFLLIGTLTLNWNSDLILRLRTLVANDIWLKGRILVVVITCSDFRRVFWPHWCKGMSHICLGLAFFNWWLHWERGLLCGDIRRIHVRS